MPIVIPSNPKEELKKNSDKYAVMVAKGIPRGRCQAFEVPTDSAMEEFKTLWAGKSLWELWCVSLTHQFYILQWATKHGSSDLKNVVMFCARAGQLPNQTVAAMRDGAKCAQVLGAGAEAAAGAVDALHKATRTLPYDVGAFKAALQPVLTALPDADVTCKAFTEADGYAFHLVRADIAFSKKKGIENFEKAAKPLLIGVGGFGLVQLAFEDEFGQPFALKRQFIYNIVKKHNEDKINQEMQMAKQIRSSFILNAAYAWMDIENKDLVLAMRAMSGGSLSYYLKKSKKAPEQAADMGGLAGMAGAAGPICPGLGKVGLQYYLGSTILALEALHEAGFIYRDLKDKNLLIDGEGRARLCDFGLSHNLKKSGPATGRSGTKGFWAPEQLKDEDGNKKEYTTTVDLWTLGVCAYHWGSAEKPYSDSDADEVKAKILKAEYDTSGGHFTKKAKEKHLFIPQLKELCAGLMTLDPEQRLGVADGGYETLKAHPFFDGLDWTKLFLGALEPPIKPSSKDIQADVPSHVKDDFYDWLKKEVPKSAEEAFAAEWNGLPERTVLETMAIEWVDGDAMFFETVEERAKEGVEPLLQRRLWSTSIVPPGGPQKRRASVAGNAGGAGGGGGGCCVIA